MLLQFAVENFGCFAEKVVLSLMAVPGEKHPEGQTMEVPGIGTVLRSAVLYGPNASGKSNLVKAFETVCKLATEGVSPGGTMPVRPHKLELFVDGVHYTYGLQATSKVVVSERLHRVDGETTVSVFEREHVEGGRPKITIGDGLDLDEHRRAFYGFVAEGTRPEQPFLAESRGRNADELDALVDMLFLSVSPLSYNWDSSRVIWFCLAVPSLPLREKMDNGEVLDLSLAHEAFHSRKISLTFEHFNAEGGTSPLEPVLRSLASPPPRSRPCRHDLRRSEGGSGPAPEHCRARVDVRPRPRSDGLRACSNSLYRRPMDPRRAGIHRLPPDRGAPRPGAALRGCLSPALVAGRTRGE